MKIEKNIRKIGFFIMILVLLIIIFSLYNKNIDNTNNSKNLTGTVIELDPTNTGNNINEGSITGKNMLTGNITESKSSQQEIIILSDFIMRKKNPLPQDYPQIIFQNIENIKNPVLIINATFTDEFKKAYHSYTNAGGYFFALKIFMGSFDNGGYFDVFRNEAGGVRNSSSQGLNGAKSGKKIAKGVSWEIPLFDTISLAVKTQERTANYQYKYFNFKDYIMKNQGKQINIGAYLSSTKEMRGRNLMYINEMKIVYEGFDGDIILNSK